MSAQVIQPEAEVNFRLLPYTVITRNDGENERQHYPEGPMEDLKASIREHGVQQNVGVGPEQPDGTFPLVWGYRRHRGVGEILAGCEATMATEGPEGCAAAQALMERVFLLPCKVLTEDEVKQASVLRLIENLQREAVDPVDEARGYRKLLDEAGEAGQPRYTIESLAEALAIPRKGKVYIRQRLKLLTAPDALLDAVRQGVVPVRVAEMVGRVPSVKSRDELARLAVADKYTGKPMTVLDVQRLIQQEYCVSLRGAEIDMEALDLLKPQEMQEYGFTAAPGEVGDGSCARCPYRSGCDPLLQGQLAERTSAGTVIGGWDDFTCQMPECFHKKQGAAWRVIEKHAEAAGNRVMSKDRVARVFAHGGMHGPDASQFVDRDSHPGHDCTGHVADESVPTWGELLAGVNVSWVVCRAPNKQVKYLLEKPIAIVAVEAQCEKLGKPNPFLNRPGKKKGGKAEEMVLPTNLGTAAAAVPETVIDKADGKGALVVVYPDVSKALPKEAKKAGGGGQEDSWKKQELARKEQEKWGFQIWRVCLEQLVDKVKAELAGVGSSPLVREFALAYAAGWDEDLVGAVLGLWVEKLEGDYAARQARTKQVVEKLETLEIGAGEWVGLVIVGQLTMDSYGYESDDFDRMMEAAGIDVAAVEKRLRAAAAPAEKPKEEPAEKPSPEEMRKRWAAVGKTAELAKALDPQGAEAAGEKKPAAKKTAAKKAAKKAPAKKAAKKK